MQQNHVKYKCKPILYLCGHFLQEILVTVLINFLKLKKLSISFLQRSTSKMKVTLDAIKNFIANTGKFDLSYVYTVRRGSVKKG